MHVLYCCFGCLSNKFSVTYLPPPAVLLQIKYSARKSYATANSSLAHSVLPFLKKGSWALFNTLLDRFGKTRRSHVPPGVLAEVPTQSVTCQSHCHRQRHASYPLAAAIYIPYIYIYIYYYTNRAPATFSKSML